MRPVDRLLKMKHLRIYTFIFFATAFFSMPLTARAADEKPESKDTTALLLPNEVLLLSDEKSIATNAFLADKTKRKLFIIQTSTADQTQFHSVFDIDIGKNDGNKTKRDDKKTPEGIYLLQAKKLPPEIPFEQYGVMAFTTNYPNVFDKFENKTGSGIWLHSIPDQVALNRGSKGCVVLRSDAIKQVEGLISLNKTPLIINNQIHWLNPEEHSAKKEAALKWLANWKSLWESQDLDKYITIYSDQFSDSNYTKSTWLKHKKSLKEKYKFVKINISKPNIFNLKDQYLFQFVQDYESDGHKDRGVKNLYVISNGQEFKILREEWAQLKD